MSRKPAADQPKSRPTASLALPATQAYQAYQASLVSPTLTVRINTFLDHWTHRLPFRGRGLFFAAGAVIGAGGLSSVALYLNRRDASVILQQGSKEDDDDDLGSTGTVCSGAVQRWVWWPWPHWQQSDAELNRTLLLLRPRAGSSATTAALVESGRRCTAVPLQDATVTVASGGSADTVAVAALRVELAGMTVGQLRRRAARMKLKGSAIDAAAASEIDSPKAALIKLLLKDAGASSLQLSIRTFAGDVEHLRNFQLGDSPRHWQLSLEKAAVATSKHGGSTPPQSAAAGGIAAPSPPSPPMRRVVNISYPRHWEAPFDRHRTVYLDRDSAEYKRVEQLALKQQVQGRGGGAMWVKGKIKVTAVERVQSPHVWEQYAMRRAIIASENQDDPNELMLWHGTPRKFCPVIARQGFDPRVCSLTGLFGGGVYFADKSTKSVRYANAQRPGDTGRMFLCRVSLGRQLRKVLPSHGLRRVPDPFPLFPSQLSPWLFGQKCHSLFAPAMTPPTMLLMNEFIVYHSNQGYPEYLVDFELV